MGNMLYLIPTKNIENYNIDNLVKILHKNFNQYNLSADGSSIQLTNIYNEVVIRIVFNSSIKKLINFKNDIDELIKMSDTGLASELRYLQDNISINLDECISYSNSSLEKEKTKVEKFLHNYFSAYIFDESIHPLYISPSYVWKKKRFFNMF